jgi:asparagine synthase (glutamine-hydrolysing)
LRADVPFGAFLSGGIDSSTVVGLMSRHLGPGVQTFTIGFAEPEFDESPFAQAANERFAARGTIERVSANMIGLWPLATYFCDQPHGDVSFMPTYRVAQLAARHVKMVLTGDGADELFAGYTKYRDLFTDPAMAGADDDQFALGLHRAISLFPEQGRDGLYAPDFATQVAGVSSLSLVRRTLASASHMDRINQALYFDTVQLLPGNNLVKPDRMGMAVSLEARDPFLDPRLVELAFHMPGELKLRGGETKYLYKRAVAPLLGEALTHRRKQMFTVPIGEWFRGELRGFCQQALLGDASGIPRYFRRETVTRLLDEHCAGTANRTREIRALISLELWRRIFLDGDFSTAPTLNDIGLSLVPGQG